MGIFSGSPTLRRRVQKRQYAAHTGDTKNSARSGYRCVMFGTGEWASSARESTRPSCTSSSCRSGTYWRQMGSPGDLMRSTMAGEKQNLKISSPRRPPPPSGEEFRFCLFAPLADLLKTRYAEHTPQLP